MFNIEFTAPQTSCIFSFWMIMAQIYFQKGMIDMSTWEDYKKHVRTTNPEIAKDIDEAETLSQIVGTMIERRHTLALSQRELAELCGLPHSSVARIESGKSTPNLSTLLKICKQLDLRFTISPVSQTTALRK